MGYGKNIDVKITEHRVEVRDFGRGIPLGKVIDCVSKINTGGKWSDFYRNAIDHDGNMLGTPQEKKINFSVIVNND